jgi:hypothetical protein
MYRIRTVQRCDKDIAFGENRALQIGVIRVCARLTRARRAREEDLFETSLPRNDAFWIIHARVSVHLVSNKL